ncbi:hypothetical protein QE250_10970 [Chromatiaceae bacterium AAb-1]|nr:hypothetical protein [Chromatiaceae bacterium AAb-1]
MKAKLFVVMLLLIVTLFWWWNWSEPVPTAVMPRPEVQQPEKVHQEAASAGPPVRLTVRHTERTELRDSFRLLAQAYAEELSYPPYSRPLLPEDEALLRPNDFIPQTVPLIEGASATVILDKYRFSYPESVYVRLEVSGLDVYDVRLQLTDEVTDKPLQTAVMQRSDRHWAARVAGEASWQGPLLVKVSFQAKGRKQQLQAGIFYSNPVATVIAVSEPGSAGSDLTIPVKLDVRQAGYYRLRANLFTADRQPLAVLTQTQYLQNGSGELVLKAHKSVLSAEGPYLLTTLLLERRPAIPGEPTLYGDSAQAEYQLEVHSLSSLSNETWQPDEQERQRLQFLQQMAGG